MTLAIYSPIQSIVLQRFLYAGADGVRIAVVDAAGHKTADSVLGAGVQLHPAGECRRHRPVTNLNVHKWRMMVIV